MKLNLMAKAAALALCGVCTVASPVLAQDQVQAPVQPGGESASLAIAADHPGSLIDRHIFGQFAEDLGTGIYGGVWVGPGSSIPNTRGIRNDVVAALRKLHVPVVRWPGGCFADTYHWRDGIGPRDKRPVRVNTHWGGVTETNAFGTHEFMDFVQQIGADAYVSANVGSGSPQEMADWVEYMTAPAGTLAEERARNGHPAPWKLAYLGLGNELWGCGGSMRVGYAADVTRRYSTFVAPPEGVTIMKMASGASDNLGPEAEYTWTEGMMRDASDKFDGFGIHYYDFPGDIKHKGSATQFDAEAWARTLYKAELMETYIDAHAAIMDKYDPTKRVAMAVDEWGDWHDPTPGSHPGFLQQQNTMRDAMVAALTLNIFSKHGDRLRLANIAQMINVLQAMILTEGPKMVLTPTYDVFEMYTPFQDATALPISIRSSWYHQDQWSVPAVSAAAARAKDGDIYIALANTDPDQPASVSASLTGAQARSVSGQMLSAPAMQSYNDFDHPQVVRIVDFTGAEISGDRLSLTLPPHAVVMLHLH